MSEDELNRLAARFQRGLATDAEVALLKEFVRRGMATFRHNNINAFLVERLDAIEAQGKLVAFQPSRKQSSN